MRIPKQVPKKYRDRIQFWDDERNMGNGIIVTLHYGWHMGDPGCHVFGEDTVASAIKYLQFSAPCSCEECNENRSTT